ncbi:MAG TPA: oxygenase MpaB family protein [Mycobacterium sp.]
MTTTESLAHVERPVSTPPARPAYRRRRGTDPGMLGIGLLAGPANVIMQLARPAIGYGVKDSRVESGRVDRHPIKRARTTFTYIAVAISGTEDQKAAFRRAVNRAHAQVYSLPDDPVAYNAFDPDLQLWVAVCMYKGVVDVYRLFVGEMDDETADEHYREAMVLGTMLQVPPEMWPKDRAAFDEYWRKSLELVHIDDAVRNYLYPIAAGRTAMPLPRLVRTSLENISLLITTGFLPQRFRDEMRLSWDARRQRRFDKLMAALRIVNNLSPKFVREFPFNVLLIDVDWRIRTGRPLV